MPAKISLTGIPKSVEVLSDYYRLSMEEGGTPNPPKGLPKSSSSITYTVLLSHKLGRKLGLPETSQRLLIQGELTLDLPLEACPGEIGVIAFQGQVLPERQEKAPESEQPRTQPAAPPLPQRQWPDLSPYPQVALNAIKVPAAFLARKPNKEKTEALKASVVAHGQLDEPIVVRPALDGVGYVLYDGYRRYIIARQLGWTTVPVDVRSISDEASSGVRAAR